MDPLQAGAPRQRQAFADCRALRDALGEPLHRTLRESQLAEVRRAATLGEDRLIATTRWLPPACP